MDVAEVLCRKLWCGPSVLRPVQACGEWLFWVRRGGESCVLSIPSLPNDAGCKAAVICRDDDIVEALGRLSPFAEGRCLTETKPRYERRYASKLISHVGKIWAP